MERRICRFTCSGASAETNPYRQHRSPDVPHLEPHNRSTEKMNIQNTREGAVAKGTLSSNACWPGLACEAWGFKLKASPQAQQNEAILLPNKGQANLFPSQSLSSIGALQEHLSGNSLWDFRGHLDLNGNVDKHERTLQVTARNMLFGRDCRVSDRLLRRAYLWTLWNSSDVHTCLSFNFPKATLSSSFQMTRAVPCVQSVMSGALFLLAPTPRGSLPRSAGGICGTCVCVCVMCECLWFLIYIARANCFTMETRQPYK